MPTADTARLRAVDVVEVKRPARVDTRVVFEDTTLRLPKGARAQVVAGVDLDVAAGETLAVVGESGSGKSVSMLAVLGLLPPAAQVEGSVRLRGEEVLGAGPERLRQRGKLPIRERIAHALDPDSPFLEISPLAGWGSDYTVGGGMVVGIGVIAGVECVELVDLGA